VKAETPLFLKDATELLDRYDTFLMDIWGTLHDGGDIFPEALAFVKAAQARGKVVCIVSNAPKRAEDVAVDLARRGLPAALYQRLMTSGEDVFEALAAENGPYALWGHTFFHI
jgi:ribonucleotide monophosphatase NagD (HAD superfamily)